MTNKVTGKVILNVNVSLEGKLLEREYQDNVFTTFGILVDAEVSEVNADLVRRAKAGEIFDLLDIVKFRSSNIYIMPEE